jgi:2-iminobutanoate/2-iminopropanoate deaminase
MPKQPLHSDKARRWARLTEVRAGDLIFVNGCGPIDAHTAQVRGETVAEQTEVVLDNVAAILAAGGAGLQDVVKATVHLADETTFPEFNDVYARRMPEPRPVRTTVGSGLRQVPGMRVEIDVIAYVGP